MNTDQDIKIFLIRHGEAGKSWDEDSDPGLSDNGKQQSKNLMREIGEECFKSPKNIFKAISSPLKRAQETAVPLMEKYKFSMPINNKFAEIPSPGIALIDRKEWLKGIFSKNINDLEKPQSDWREEIIKSLKELKENTIIFSHFMVINCIAGHLTGSKEMVSFYPDNCSVTKISLINKELKLIELGKQLKSVVL